MIRITVAAFLALAWLLSGEEALVGLKPATKGGAIRQEVQQRLCYAGRFQFERGDEAKDLFVGRFLEQVPSCEGHPNAEDLGEVRVVLLGNEEFQPEAGGAYSLILTDGSKRGMTLVAYGPDDAATAKELREVIESPSAFENDATWRKRRALWAKLRKDLGPDEKPLLYCEDESLRRILFVKGGDVQFPLHLYDMRTGKSEPIIHAKVLPGMNRITYDEGSFRVWFNGSVEMSIGTGDSE
jgi:hypothetical protein